MARYTRLLDDNDTPYRSYAVAIDSLNVRGGPGTDHPVFMKLKEGDVVIEIDRDIDGDWNSGWTQVKTADGKHGWVAHRYLRQL